MPTSPTTSATLRRTSTASCNFIDSYCGGPNNRYAVQYTYFDEWIGMMDEFCDCILNNKQPKINLQWHRQTVEAMVKCYESIYTGKPVYLNK